MTCPGCKKEIDLGLQVAHADKEFYEGIEPPMVLMIMCENCENQTAMIDIVPMEEGDFQDVVSPALGGKVVKVPKPRDIYNDAKKGLLNDDGKTMAELSRIFQEKGTAPTILGFALMVDDSGFNSFHLSSYLATGTGKHLMKMGDIKKFSIIPCEMTLSFNDKE